MSKLTPLTAQFGYEFSDDSLLQRALTHRSADRGHNERMEFLGDAILGFLIADALYRNFPDAREGDLTRARAALVRRETLASIARELEIGNYLRVGVGELKTGGRDRGSILADALEALVGAIYLDGGIEICRGCVAEMFGARLSKITVKNRSKDSKTELQELLQSRQVDRPTYVLRDVEGEAHARSFTVECQVDALSVSTLGTGTSVRKAEQEAARKMLASITDG